MTATGLRHEVLTRARAKNWTVAHLPRATELPALLLVREQRLLSLVLTNRPATPEQQGWLDVMAMAGVETWTVGEADLDTELARLLR